MKNIFLLSAGLALLTACGGNAENTDATPQADTGMASENVTTTANEDTAAATADASMAMPTDAAGYAAMAGASDMFEIESSKAAMAKSNNADVDKFAQMMVDHHTKSTEQVKAAAKAANITLTPPKLDAMQQKMLDDIKNADAANVDRVYWQHQRTAHEAALKLHQGYASNGDNAEMKKVASEIVPVVQKHLTEIQGKMGS